jgi:hypothetical protein
MLDLRTELSALPERRRPGPPGHEHVRGWGVFGLPFDSGHVLGLRVFPENDFGPYRTVWHRDPEGRWSIWADGPRVDAACPRYYGAACAHTGPAQITVAWTGPASFRVHLDEPELDWAVRATRTPLLRALNGVGRPLPDWTWSPGPLLAAREMLARRVLELGDLRLSGPMPSGHHGVLMPRRMYWIDCSTALLHGRDLGRPTHLDASPTIGSVTLPARGVLAVGQAVWRIEDPEEYEEMRRLTAPEAVAVE